MKKTGLTAFMLLAAMAVSVAGMAGCNQDPTDDGNDPSAGVQTPVDGTEGNGAPADGEKPDNEEKPDNGDGNIVGGLIERDLPYVNDADDAPVKEELPFDDSVKYSYSYAFRTVNGQISAENGVYTAQAANSMAVDNKTAFPYGTISCTVRSNNTNDSGIVFGLSENGASSYWENGVSYYFFFLGQGGNAYLGKVNGGWSALKVVKFTSAIDSSKDYTLKVVLKSNKICCYIDGELMFGYKDEKFLEGTCYGLRAGAAGVTFSNVSVTNEYFYD